MHRTRPRPHALFAVAPALLFGATLAFPSGQDPAEGDNDRFFTERVLPILEANCFGCHGGEDFEGEFALTSAEGLAEGGVLGPAWNPEDPGSSLLLRAVRYETELLRMPPGGRLADADVATLEAWIERGAPYPEGFDRTTAEREAPATRGGRGDGLEGWSYRPIERPSIPQLGDPEWATNPIDAFVLARLEAAGLEPNPPADPVELIRRVTYDLTGLPPTPEQVDAFVADTEAGAWGRLVDRLLDSPQYGERWGRHWLDLVRYAETNGYERDSDKPFIWRYRDYVIDAFNEDKPYDRFILEQLAGDELDEVTPASLTATGYQRLMIWDDEPGQGRLQARYDTLDDIVSTSAGAFLGMSLGCARCHDHKKDPIPQEDYYRFMAFFHGVTDMSVNGHLTDVSSPEERAERERLEARKRADEDEVLLELDTIETRFRRASYERSLALNPGEDAGPGAGGLLDLEYAFYRDTWDRIPDFEMMRAEDRGPLPLGRIDLDVATRRESIGLVYRGDLLNAEAVEVEFRLSCRGGARLSVGGEVIIDHDGRHEPDEMAIGRASLPAGRVSVLVEYVHREGEPHLQLDFSEGEDIDFRYLTEEPSGDWTAIDFDDAPWSVGAPGFGRRGTPGSVIGTEWHGPSIWMRRDFDWSGRELDDLLLAIHYDDDIEVYLNGVLALERKGYIVAYESAEILPEARAALRRGKNTLAVHCIQDFGGQYVHIAPIDRRDLGQGSLTDLAFARHVLTGSGASGPRPIAERIEAEGADLLGQQALDRWRDLRGRLDRIRKRPIPTQLAPAIQEHGPHPAQMFVHLRGSAEALGDPVEPGYPVCVDARAPVIPAPAEGAPTSGRRRVLAEWIVSGDNPLTARVAANRIWQHHFGRGIVESPNDFGELGERPTHPDLLDWLAVELRDNGWSWKHLHRRILHSSTYRMSSRAQDAGLGLDPSNRLFWRFDPRRLSAEELRDSILSLTGKLNLEMGGPPFYAPMPKAVLATASRPDAAWGRSDEQETHRRSIYNKVKRSLALPILASFDQADTDASCPVRFATTQPTQALSLLNSEFSGRHARSIAERLRVEADNDEDRIRHALRLATSREARAEEVADYLALLGELRSTYGRSEDEALVDFCLLLINLNEFAYLD